MTTRALRVVREDTDPAEGPGHEMPCDLDPRAPHSPERTRQLADTAAEAVRALNYATLPGQGGLTYPGDAYDLLAGLGTLAERLPQLCQQVARWLTDEQRAGHLVEGAHGPCGGSDALAVAHAADALSRAAGSAVVLRGMLGRAQSDISAVSYAGPDDDQDDDDGVICPHCDGRGYFTADDDPGQGDCLACGGTGRETDDTEA